MNDEVVCVICQYNNADDINYFPCNCRVRFHKDCWQSFVNKGVLYCPYCRKVYEVRIQVPMVQLENVPISVPNSVPNSVPISVPNSVPNSVPRNVVAPARAPAPVVVSRNVPIYVSRRTACRIFQICVVSLCGIMVYEMLDSYNNHWYDFSLEVLTFMIGGFTVTSLEFNFLQFHRLSKYLMIIVVDLVLAYSVYGQVLIYTNNIHNALIAFITIMFTITFYFFIVMTIVCFCMSCLCRQGDNSFELCFCLCRTFDGDVEYCSLCGSTCVE